LIPAAGRLRLLDTGGGIGLHREASREGRKLVAGVGLALGIWLTWFMNFSAGFVRQFAVDESMAWLAIFLALGVGLVDDVLSGGLQARWKLLGQCLPALAFAAGVPAGDVLLGTLAFAAALSAQNLANTFDNADGALLAVGVLALAPSRPEWSICLLAALCFNLRWRAPARVLLGDSGSHLIAMLLLCEPRAWGAFLLPALDLARVVLVRRAQSRAPWLGDRTHLAHRLQARGCSPVAVAGTLAAAALPGIWATAYAGSAWSVALGLGLSTAAFAVLVLGTPAVDGVGRPLSTTRFSRWRAGVDRAH
jgi:hypothetical protein